LCSGGDIACLHIHRAAQPIRPVGECAGFLARARPGDALDQAVLRVPGIGPASAGQRVAVGVIGVAVTRTGQEHVGGVVSVVFRSGGAVHLLGAVAHRIESVTLRLSVPVVDRTQAVQVVVAVNFGARTAYRSPNKSHLQAISRLSFHFP